MSNYKQQVVVEGVQSCESPITSGVPKGSVLGPFLMHGNLPMISSFIAKFPPQDHTALQEDLDQLVGWKQDWGMEFHSGMCSVIGVTRARKPKDNTYTLH